MDKAMSAALMADFSDEAIGHKPATWCKACAKAVRDRAGRSCGDHKEIRCKKCRTKITEAHTCLDFVGHADVRARLLAKWTRSGLGNRSSSPSTGSLILSDGSPVGLWIHLTVGGVTRPGYGSCDKGKPEAIKELIGDALRNAGLSFGIAWKLWAKGERTGSDGEDSGQQSAADCSTTPSPARPPRRQRAPRGQVARPAAQAVAAAPDDGEPDQDAQQYADQAHGATTLGEVEEIHQKAREAGKIGAFIRSPSSGKTGKLAVYIDWKRKQLKDVEAAWEELNAAAGKHRTGITDLENEFKIKTGAEMETATAPQIRDFIASLDKAAAA